MGVCWGHCVTAMSQEPVGGEGRQGEAGGTYSRACPGVWSTAAPEVLCMELSPVQGSLHHTSACACCPGPSPG